MPPEEGPDPVAAATQKVPTLEHQQSTTFLSAAHSTVVLLMEENENGNGNGGNASSPGLTKSSGGFHLRWTRIHKQVEVKPEVHGLLAAAKHTTATRSRSFRKQPPPDSNSSSNDASSRTVAPPRQSNSYSSGAFHVKTILHQVSGQAVPGQVLATMGPSGSGKTSLMNVLSGRAAYQEGTISVNGHPLSKSNLKRLMKKIAYVKQADIFFGHLTVRDQFTYTARLRLNESPEVIRQEVDRILRLLRLQKVGDSPIMMLSGGEKKRVNIGTSFRGRWPGERLSLTSTDDALFLTTSS
jgi:ABC-type multidrug transport system fused ATPase/permease subunit